MKITIGFRAAARGSALRGDLDAKMSDGASAWRSSQMRSERLTTVLHFFGHQCGLEGRTPRARETYGILQEKFSQFLPGELE
jgi:hypothetical protein